MHQRIETKGARRAFHPWYIESRKAMEAKLREKFAAKGGRIHRQSPHYFVWGESSVLAQTEPNMQTVAIPLTEIDPCYLSFTLPDSMTTFKLAELLPPPTPTMAKFLPTRK